MLSDDQISNDFMGEIVVVPMKYLYYVSHGINIKPTTKSRPTHSLILYPTYLELTDRSTGNIIHKLSYRDIMKWKGEVNEIIMYYEEAGLQKTLVLYSTQYIDILDRLYKLCLVQAKKLGFK